MGEGEGEGEGVGGAGGIGREEWAKREFSLEPQDQTRKEKKKLKK